MIARANGAASKPQGLQSKWKGARVYTIGHSTRTIDEFLESLRSFDVCVLVDIRTIPRSRHNPQFNRDALPSVLRRTGLEYIHLPRLGGLRRARKDSLNTAWRNASFRGFADYMLTEEFETSLSELRALLPSGHLALMCAEAVPWRCHRSLVADALTARGALVEHITGVSRSLLHQITAFAHVEGERVTYPGVHTERELVPLGKRSRRPGASVRGRESNEDGTDLAAQWHHGARSARDKGEPAGRRPHERKRRESPLEDAPPGTLCNGVGEHADGR